MPRTARVPLARCGREGRRVMTCGIWAAWGWSSPQGRAWLGGRTEGWGLCSYHVREEGGDKRLLICVYAFLLIFLPWLFFFPAPVSYFFQVLRI